MELSLQGIGKRFGKDWIIKDVDLHLPEGSHTAITGANGSGKSTLMKIIAGFLSPTKGKIHHHPIDKDAFYKEVSIVAPYLDIYRDLDMKQQLRFHFSMRDYVQGMNEEALIDILSLPSDRPISSFSSGMVQRLKIGLALSTQSSVLLLDEACMNLDKNAMDWYASSLKRLAGDRLVIVASNTEGVETESCTRRFKIEGRNLSMT
jgi:ABC-type multidrug transport system ATPase subunit